MSPNCPVVVLGSGITALGVVRALGAAGHKPYLACRPGDLAGRSRWVRGRWLDIPESDDPIALHARLERSGIGEAVLIGCSDLWVTAISRLPAESREHLHASVPSQHVLNLLVDKWLFAQTLIRLEVPHPATVFIEDRGDLADIDLGGTFLKPRHSQQFADLFQRKAFSYESLEEAHEAYDKIAEAGLEAVVQEYIPGSPTLHIFVDGFVDAAGTVSATLARQRLRMFPPDFGNSTLTVSVAPDTVADAIDSVTRLLRGIDYRGIFSAEFKLDQRDGRHKLLEVNARPWWYIGFAAHCGVDVAPMAYLDALGLPVAQAAGYTVGKRCVLLSQEIRAYLYLRRRGEIRFWPWLKSWLGSTPTVFAWSDPMPAATWLSVAMRRGINARRRAGEVSAEVV